MRELRVRLFGPFQIVHGDRPICAPMLRKAQELLALVLLAPNRNIRREVAGDTVWPSSGPDTSRKAMRQALWQIHQATDTSLPGDQRLVLTDGEALRLNPERPLWVDVDAFTAAARTAQATGVDALSDAALDWLAAATELCRGPLLEACDHEWCLVERTHLEDLQLTVLDRLSTAHERRGRTDAAIHWAQRLLEIEPAHERSHRRLMRLYYESDDRTRALRQYQRCRWTLEHELGIRPSSRTEALAVEIGADVRPGTIAPAIGDGALDDFRAELAALRASVDAIGDRLRNALA